MRLVCDRLKCGICELQVNIVELKFLLILLDQSVLRFGQYRQKCAFVEFAEGPDHGQSTHELRDQTIVDQVLRLQVIDRLDVALLIGLDIRLKAKRLVSKTLLDDLFQSNECSAADEQNVRRIELLKVLLRMFSAAACRDIGNGTLEDLQQRLLDTFARHIACDRWIVVLAADLIDLVNIDDALLGLFKIAAGRLDEAKQDILDIFADIACLG